MKSETNSTFTLLVGGADFKSEDLDDLYPRAQTLVAVDGGANSLFDTYQPDYIVGDMDSIDTNISWNDTVGIHKISTQNTTDLEKSISFCIDKKLPQPFVFLGFTGGRFDQTLTILHASCRFPDHKLIFIAEEDLITTLPIGRSNFKFAKNERVSLYPLTACDFGPSKGLLYPLNNLHMEQGHAIGTSNKVVDEQVEIELLSGLCFMITEAKRPLALFVPLA